MDLVALEVVYDLREIRRSESCTSPITPTGQQTEKFAIPQNRADRLLEAAQYGYEGRSQTLKGFRKTVRELLGLG
jgi:hypothetical protein